MLSARFQRLLNTSNAQAMTLQCKEAIALQCNLSHELAAQCNVSGVQKITENSPAPQTTNFRLSSCSQFTSSAIFYSVISWRVEMNIRCLENWSYTRSFADCYSNFDLHFKGAGSATSGLRVSTKLSWRKMSPSGGCFAGRRLDNERDSL